MPAPAPPEVIDAAFVAVAEGRSKAEAGRIAGVTRTAVGNWLQRFRDRADRIGTLVRHAWARNVLRSVDAITQAQAQAASDPACRHGPQAARVLLEGAGIIGGVRDLTIVGDVDASTTIVDARRVQLIQGADRATIDAEVKRLSKSLGLET